MAPNVGDEMMYLIHRIQAEISVTRHSRPSTISNSAMLMAISMYIKYDAVKSILVLSAVTDMLVVGVCHIYICISRGRMFNLCFIPYSLIR